LEPVAPLAPLATEEVKVLLDLQEAMEILVALDQM
jgi:hypothetical protein